MDDSNKVAARIQKESPSATDDPSTAAKKPRHDDISSLKDEYGSIIIPYCTLLNPPINLRLKNLILLPLMKTTP